MTYSYRLLGDGGMVAGSPCFPVSEWDTREAAEDAAKTALNHHLECYSRGGHTFITATHYEVFDIAEDREKRIQFSLRYHEKLKEKAFEQELFNKRKLWRLDIKNNGIHGNGIKTNRHPSEQQVYSWIGHLSRIERAEFKDELAEELKLLEVELRETMR